MAASRWKLADTVERGMELADFHHGWLSSATSVLAWSLLARLMSCPANPFLWFTLSRMTWEEEAVGCPRPQWE